MQGIPHTKGIYTNHRSAKAPGLCSARASALLLLLCYGTSRDRDWASSIALLLVRTSFPPSQVGGASVLPSLRSSTSFCFDVFLAKHHETGRASYLLTKTRRLPDDSSQPPVPGRRCDAGLSTENWLDLVGRSDSSSRIQPLWRINCSIWRQRRSENSSERETS